MDMARIHAVYFSATFTTRRVVAEAARRLGAESVEYDITMMAPKAPVKLGPQDLLLVGVPVYAGRVPATAAERLALFSGEGTPAVLICVYGNRDYDDALAELQDIVEARGFVPVSAAAFIARHSIFSHVAADRPDAVDMAKVGEFCERTAASLSSRGDLSAAPRLHVAGNRPYKPLKCIPLHPSGGRACDGCGACVRSCPAGAIEESRPRRTDGEKCISCGRCVAVCPRGARRFDGVLYRVVRRKFEKEYARRREPEMFYL